MSSTDTSLFGFNKSPGSATAEIAALVKALEGPDYSYVKAMNTPGDLNAGMQPGDVKADLNAINDYIRVLIAGDGPARKGDSNQPIGDRYLLNTGAKCKGVNLVAGCANDKAGCPPIASGDAALVPRYTIINNIPNGKSSIFPTKLSSTGTAFDSFEGIIPGIIYDVLDFDPAAMFSAFLLPPYPQCAEATVMVNTGEGVKGTDYNFEPVKKYVILSDLQRQDPCIFEDKTNPVTGEKCTEGFTTYAKQAPPTKAVIPADPMVRLYFILVSLFGAYIVYKVLVRERCK